MQAMHTYVAFFTVLPFVLTAAEVTKKESTRLHFDWP